MIIKKFVVNDMKEALTRARYELGDQAILVTQREVKIGKWFFPFKRRKLEVTFALEDKPIINKKDDETEKIEKTEESKESEVENRREVDEEKNKSIKKETTTNSEINKGKMPTEVIGDKDISMDVDPFFLYAGEDIRNRLVSYCRLHNKEDYKLSEKERKDFLDIILKESPFGRGEKLSRINVLIGPTGVGKTTTIAKLAASQQLGNRSKVGLITMDTYRIGAIQQLKTYAEILNVPFYVANNPKEMKEKIDLMKNCDIILVDTLGTSPRDMTKLIEIKKNLNAMGETTNTYLVMSMSTDRDSMESIVERYRMLNYDAMILTKVDEVENTKNLWYLIERNLVPIQYFCHGQDVPDDIKEATPETIFKYFEESFAYDRSSWKTKRNY